MLRLRSFVIHRGLFVSLCLTAVGWGSLSAQNTPPQIGPISIPSTIPEMGLRNASVSVSDAEGDPVTLTWSFQSDPTGQAIFYDALGAEFGTSFTGTRFITLQVGVGTPGDGPDAPTAVQGQEVTVLVRASDGTGSTTRTKKFTVQGFNQRPVLSFKTEGMGTVDDPRLSGEGMSLTASDTFDPDNDTISYQWRIASTSGGTPCPGKGLVLFSRETAQPGVTIPLVTAFPGNPMRINLAYIIRDQIYVLTDTVTGFAASPTGCTPSQPISRLLG